MDQRKFLFVLASARADGNTEPLPAFEDNRHEGEGVYAQPAGNEKTLFKSTLEATDIVIASPLYWYSVSAQAKVYIDYWSG